MKLSHEDRILWGRVARSATPLPGRVAFPAPEPQAVSAPPVTEPVSARLGAVAAALPKPPDKQIIDRPTRQKLSKGRLAIEARVDLHGLTQGEAHGLLLSFLHRAHAGGLRHVLVITGKGAGGDGVLKRAVPSWFATASFRGLVGGYELAARPHGGDGALYVRLRRVGTS